MRRPADRTSAGFDRVSYWASVLRSAHAGLRFSSQSAAWAAFWNGIAEDYESRTRDASDLVDLMVGLVLREGLLRGGDRLLEIGCGPGTFTLPLAPHVTEILAIDPSAAMVRLLEARAGAAGIGNIRTAVAEWEECRPESHDVVVSAFCPSLFTPRSLCRMNRIAGRTAIIISFTGYRSLGAAEGVWRKVMGTDPPQSPSAVAVFNYLFAKGLRPSMLSLPYELTRRHSSDGMRRKYELYFSIFTRLTPEQKTLIRNEVARLEKRTRPVSAVKRTAVVIWWNNEVR